MSHRYKVGATCRFVAANGEMSPLCVKHLGHEVQITRHINERTQVDAPTYEVQCLCNGTYFYCAEACLVPKTQEKGDWSALAQFYTPPSRRTIDEMSKFVTLRSK